MSSPNLNWNGRRLQLFKLCRCSFVLPQLLFADLSLKLSSDEEVRLNLQAVVYDREQRGNVPSVLS